MRSGCYDGAYYFTGFAVECALKACIARQVRRYDFPKKRTVEQSYTHDLKTLMRTAGLEDTLDKESKTNPALARNWAVVKDWNNESRYTVIGQTRARELYSSVAERANGLMSWIRQHW